MFKRSHAHYSLWPEQRPRRGRPLRFAVGSFALGAICATAYSTLFSLTDPATGHGFSTQPVVEPIPIVIAREPKDAVPMPSPKPADIASNRPGRARSAAKVMLPLIGAPAPRPPVTTDGRGGGGLGGEMRLTGPEPVTEDNPSLLGGDSEPSREPPVQDAATETKPTAAKSITAEPGAVVPMPRVAPFKTVATKEDSPAPTSQAADDPEPRGQAAEPSGEPDARPIPAAKAKRVMATEVHSERRGVIVLTRRSKPMESAASVEVQGQKRLVRTERSKPSPAMTATAPKRRGYVVVKKARKQVTRLARKSDRPARKLVARTSQPQQVRAASASKRSAAPHRNIARKAPAKPTRYVVRSRPKRETLARHAPPRGRQDNYGPMITRATQMLRTFAAGQGYGLPGGF